MKLQVENLTKRFPGVTALDGVSFDLHSGEVHALCGENGAGKSTLIKCLSGVYPHGSYEGVIRLDGTPAAFADIAGAEHAGIAVIHQELALVRELTVAENIFLGHEPVRRGLIDRNRLYADTRTLFARYGVDLDPAAKTGRLGIGQQQLVEIFKALSRNSRVLLLDEPTAALSQTETGILLGIVRQLRERGIACVYISHRLDEVLAISDRITVFRDGRTVGTLTTADATKAEIIRRMVGRDITDLFPRQAGIPGEVKLEIAGLTVNDERTDRPILTDISLQVRAGEVLGLGGLMGAGRTELLMHLMGVMGRRRGGTVRLKGADLPACTPPARVIERGLILVSEERRRYGFVAGTSIAFNLSLTALERFCHGGWIDAAAEARSNQQQFDQLGVKAPGLHARIDGLSGGNQQKVVLGKALMITPEVILLDEPTRGIDVGAKHEIYQLINRLTAEGMAVILVSSELPELMGMSDRVLILSAGRIGGAFTRPEFKPEDFLRAAMAFHPGSRSTPTAA